MIATALFVGLMGVVTSFVVAVIVRQCFTIRRQRGTIENLFNCLEMTKGNLLIHQDAAFKLQDENLTLKVALGRTVEPIDPADLPESRDAEVIERWLADE